MTPEQIKKASLYKLANRLYILGNLKQLDEKVIKHLPKYCIDKYLKESSE